ncbi:MAG TPA: Na+/H+ antiporter [Anaerolineae bacterium]|nr:Na+/H+ antiporter [Anaerolineae bacterium]
MENLLQTETLIIELLVVASLVAIVAQRIKLPYTVALVLVGFALTLFGSTRFDLTKDLILAIFLPPLLFEAAFHVDFQALRRSLKTILLLAIVGVLISAFIVGGLVSSFTTLSFVGALLFGTLIVATDPVAVTALFSSLGAPKQLSTIVEGESLFNDGAAIVLFNIVLGVALTGEFSLATGLLEFAWVSLGGIGIGLGLGWLAAQLIARVDNYLIETTITAALAFGAYLVGEEIHVSGVLAVVAAGILNGNFGTRGMSASTKIVLFNFWEYVAFLANSLIFLLIGLEVEFSLLSQHFMAILIGFAAVMVARVIVIYGLGHFLNTLGIDEGLSLPYQHVLTWGGLRGAVSLALALGLPFSLGETREMILAMTFGVVLIMLLAQATTMEWLLKRLGLVGRPNLEVEYELQRGKLLTARAARRQLEEMHDRGELSAKTWETLQDEVSTAEQTAYQELQELVQTHSDLEALELESTRRELLFTRRAELSKLRRTGLLEEEAFDQLAEKYDRALHELSNPEP